MAALVRTLISTTSPILFQNRNLSDLSTRGGQLITLQNLSMRTVATDFKAELRRLNRELLFTFLDLLDCLVQRPSAYARAVENVGLIARNMSYLLNALRSEQASLLTVLACVRLHAC